MLGLEQPDVYTAALCALIGAQGGLYATLPAGDVLGRLDVIARTNDQNVRAIIAAVDATSASASVSMYR